MIHIKINLCLVNIVVWHVLAGVLHCSGSFESLSSLRDSNNLSQAYPRDFVWGAFNDFPIILPEVFCSLFGFGVVEFGLLLNSMSHIVLPLPFVGTAVCVFFYSEAVGLAIDEVTSVSRAICPSHGSLSVYAVLLKLTLIHLT